MKPGQIVRVKGREGTWVVHRLYLDDKHVDLHPHTARTIIMKVPVDSLDIVDTSGQ